MVLLGTGVRAAEIFQPLQREHTGRSAGGAMERTVCSCKGPVNHCRRAARPPSAGTQVPRSCLQKDQQPHRGLELHPAMVPALRQMPDRRKEHHPSDRSETKQTNHPQPPSARPDLLSTFASGSCPCDSESKHRWKGQSCFAPANYRRRTAQDQPELLLQSERELPPHPPVDLLWRFHHQSQR